MQYEASACWLPAAVGLNGKLTTARVVTVAIRRQVLDASLRLSRRVVHSVLENDGMDHDHFLPNPSSYSGSVRVTLRLAVYRQSVRLGDEPLETHDQNFYFPTEHLRF
jgi:hypothetical protein